MEDAASPNTKTITDNIKEELAKDDLDVKKFLSLASEFPVPLSLYVYC